MKAAIYYVLAIVIANLGFSYIPMIPIGFGEMFAPMSLLVGFLVVRRDYAQQELGHKVLIKRWARIPTQASEKLTGSKPRSSRRVIVSGAELVCSVDKTR